MQKWLLGACAAALLSTNAAAQQHFTFSASLLDSTNHGQITGTFDGTLNGNLITNLSNVAVTYNGTPFPTSGASTSSTTTILMNGDCPTVPLHRSTEPRTTFGSSMVR